MLTFWGTKALKKKKSKQREAGKLKPATAKCCYILAVARELVNSIGHWQVTNHCKGPRNSKNPSRR